MPFVDNYIGFHDAGLAAQRSATRGVQVRPRSHGCVNLPPEKAVELYDLIKVGGVVVSHPGRIGRRGSRRDP